MLILNTVVSVESKPMVVLHVCKRNSKAWGVEA